MFMKKKKQKCHAPSLALFVALPLLAVGGYMLMKKKGKAMLHSAKCCCEAGESMMSELTK